MVEGCMHFNVFFQFVYFLKCDKGRESSSYHVYIKFCYSYVLVVFSIYKVKILCTIFVSNDQTCFILNQNINEKCSFLWRFNNKCITFKNPNLFFLCTLKQYFIMFVECFYKFLMLSNWVLFYLLIPHISKQINCKVDYKWSFLLWFQCLFWN